jgi:hypothetical protein
MGRCYIKPTINIFKPGLPKLQNYKVHYPNKIGGELYASFELVLVSNTKILNQTKFVNFIFFSE